MYVHDLNPFAIQFSEHFGIRWYGLSYMIGFICAYLLIRWLTSRQRAGLNPNMVGDFITYVAIGTLVGGRLGYVIFYSPDLFLKFKGDFPFWGVFAINEGGMASHGGMIGIVLACLFFARRHGVNFLYLLDLVSVSGPIGVFFGRIANFINGELVGRPAPDDFPLSVKFPQDILNWPTADFAKLSSLTSVVDKVNINSEQWLEMLQKFEFDTVTRSQVYDALAKVVTEIQNGNSAVKESLAPLLVARYPSQLFAAFGEGLLLFLILFFLWRKGRKPGFIAATFIVLYSLVRILDEYFRMPDAAIGYQWLGLTRGQWLSVGMFFIGISMMFLWMRSNSLNIPGWNRGHSIRLGRK
ncbi:prolipoprotein diacylglyceryl transferase [Bdellovibrio sp. HCB337]|uniref:prolipoprotein diacylglyceryl transferase n=1 Tax=Bdellovibrio sp. HCB337 TaxID=3394358 RepID=UPI0039A5087D